jgi:alkanesulfonate monooxygenase SsuD/methylene tetrahydromethanopterin reductase-like flavin-dependent oxidoreductase (luciferase family)
MKYGIHLPNFGPFGYASVLAEIAKEAEDAGWDGFFIWDHINRPQVLDNVDPWVALSAIAMKTSNIIIGPHITPFPRRRPWKLVREAVSVDHLSNGRLIIGFGIGSSRSEEWDAFGEELDLKTRGKMLDEGLDIFSGLCTGEPFSYQGKFYKVDETTFLPKPINGTIPLWGGGYWPSKPPFRRTARYAGVFPIFKDLNDEAGQLRDVIEYAKQHRDNESPFDVVYMSDPIKPDQWANRADMVAPYAEAGATWWLEFFKPDHYGGQWDGNWHEDKIRERIRQGPPKP